eukprot:39718_1
MEQSTWNKWLAIGTIVYEWEAHYGEYKAQVQHDGNHNLISKSDFFEKCRNQCDIPITKIGLSQMRLYLDFYLCVEKSGLRDVLEADDHNLHVTNLREVLQQFKNIGVIQTREEYIQNQRTKKQRKKSGKKNQNQNQNHNESNDTDNHNHNHNSSNNTDNEQPQRTANILQLLTNRDNGRNTTKKTKGKKRKRKQTSGNARKKRKCEKEELHIDNDEEIDIEHEKSTKHWKKSTKHWKKSTKHWK